MELRVDATQTHPGEGRRSGCHPRIVQASSYLKLPGRRLSATRVDRAGEQLRRSWFEGPGEAFEHDSKPGEAATVLFDFRELFEYPLTKVTTGLRRFVIAEVAGLQGRPPRRGARGRRCAPADPK